ncbi:phospho-sugar mutase [Ruminococcaceae bacterium OttesenSCG-928-I18]|nr:phospho-sugar mutase [Ruminococcaceae bacterium OttesenSCG-928-I18]
MYLDEYKRWRSQKLEDPDLREELDSIEGQDDEIKDRFAIDLSFGTAGLRGVIGAGTNRMNLYTVRRATQGLAAYLLQQKEDPTVAIAYDSRIKSDLFAKQAASVLAANGIRVCIHPRLQPVPILSFTVRELKCDAGIMITASHNPAKYNGYKVYGADGCQLGTDAAAAVLAQSEKLDIFKDVRVTSFEGGLQDGDIEYVEDAVLEAYYANVKAQAIRPGIAKETTLKLVYSPLNGTGNIPVRRILADMGFQNLTVVPEQEMPDGNFPTAPYPNPEVRESLALGLALAQKTEADLLLATDPDADRVGIAVRDRQGHYQLLSGNEVGVLLLDYISSGRLETGTMPGRPLTVRSLVSTPMADAVAAKYKVEMVKVLTGFKYIGEEIARLEQRGEKNRFIFGFEESYGYLAGTHVRDKDAVVASMLICEMAAFYKGKGSSLYEAMERLYRELGRYLAVIDNFVFEGLAGMDTMAAIMDTLRKEPLSQIAGYPVLSFADYERQTLHDFKNNAESRIALPKANVVEYHLEGGHTVIVRPSGTEPKIKIYYTAKGEDKAEAESIQQKLAAGMKPLMR